MAYLVSLHFEVAIQRKSSCSTHTGGTEELRFEVVRRKHEALSKEF